MLEIAKDIIGRLEEAGYSTFLVGGSVRDLLMGIPFSDIDVATEARPEEVTALFSGEECFAVPTGLEHGTVTVVMGGVNCEVTTFRCDVSCDGRRSTVEFGSTIEEDLSRRDFTINAIAYSPERDEYIDPFSGRGDIERGIIRAVGSPIERFREDYLRMIRAHRFEAALEFEIEEGTRDGLKEAAADDWFGLVSVERTRDEIAKCFARAERPSLMFSGMQGSSLLEKTFPELIPCIGFEQNRFHSYDIFTHTLLTIDAVPAESHDGGEREVVRWAALFHDLGKVAACENYGPEATFYGHESVSVELAGEIMKRYKFGNDKRRRILKLVEHHSFHYTDEMKDAAIRRLVNRVGLENINDLSVLRYADRIARGAVDPEEARERAFAIERRIERMAAEERVFKIKDLAIGGREVMDILGLPSSPRIGEILQELYDMVIEDPAKNTPEELKRIVEKM